MTIFGRRCITPLSGPEKILRDVTILFVKRRFNGVIFTMSSSFYVKKLHLCQFIKIIIIIIIIIIINKIK